MKKLAFPALALAGVLSLAACSGQPAAAPASTPGGGAATGQAAPGEAKKVSIGTLPIVPTAVIHMGVEKGFFQENGLDVTIETGQGGAALLPAVISGTMQFATGNPVSLLVARERGLDVRVIASYTYDTAEGVHGVVVKQDSGIDNCGDLAGKNIAINTLKSMGDLHIMDAIEKQGGDPKTANFVELGFPQMLPALEQGNVQGAWVPEPFLTLAQEAGHKVACYDGVESVEGHPTMMFFTSADLVDRDKATVDAMRTAINKAMDYAQDNPDEVREVAVAKMNVNPEVAKAMVLEDFGGPVRTAQVEETGKLMVKYGFINKEADVTGLLQSVNG